MFLHLHRQSPQSQVICGPIRTQLYVILPLYLNAIACAQAEHKISAHRRRTTVTSFMKAGIPHNSFNWDAGSVLRKAHNPTFWSTAAAVAPVHKGSEASAPRRQQRSSAFDEDVGLLATQAAKDRLLSSSPQDVLKVRSLRL